MEANYGRAWTNKVITCLFWAALISPTLVCAVSSSSSEEYSLGLHAYKVVEFSAHTATKETYAKFVEALRRGLASEYKRHDIPVLRAPYTVANADRFLLVKLSNEPGGSITLALDITDANVVAYQAGRESYFFTDSSNLAFSDLFTMTEKKRLSFGGTYAELEKAAGATRQVINLGIVPLDEAITALYRSSSTQENLLARSLIVVIQMVSGAARFRYIEQQVRFSIRTDSYQSFRPDLAIIQLENSWIRLSSEVQESYQTAFTGSAVQLRRANGEIFYVDSVSAILKANLALMKFICRSTEPSSSSSSSSSSPLLRMVSDDYDDTCLTLEPTMKIVGRNGLCIVVRNQNYEDGNPLILWDCGINHFWTFKRDGTIRRNNKCLTTYNFGPESYVMIYNCSTAPRPTILWTLNTNGSIINPVSGQSLTAVSPKLDTILGVDNTVYASSQGWLPSNYTVPFRASIVGFGDLCLSVKGNNLVLQGCVNGGIGREWIFYTDGTIRNTGGRCLTCNSPFKGSEVIMMDCNPGGWSSQRWMFNPDGSILNLKSGMVLDVEASDLSVGRVIIWTSKGAPNQKWLPLL